VEQCREEKMAKTKLEEARDSLVRVQTFDVTTLPREAALGEAFNFRDAVEPATRVIRLFQQFPESALSDLPPGQLSKIKNTSDGFFNILNNILQFNVKQENPQAAHSNTLNSVKNQYEQIFNEIHELIAYGISRQQDVSALEMGFRAAIQAAEDKTKEITESLVAAQNEASRILDDVRKVAAEQGVSQQAFHFARESTAHEAAADNWRKWTIRVAIGLGLFAAASIFLHKLEILKPADTYESIQLALSKGLLFAVIAYVLLLCARSYQAHTHNAIVNKHRQNALLTYKALADAAGNDQSRDVILNHAASCIFAPQETGYAKGTISGQQEMPLNIIQSMPKVSA
jgi:hypothetical protein